MPTPAEKIQHETRSYALPYMQRAEELESVLTSLMAAWAALPDYKRLNVVASVRRGLIDMACSDRQGRAA